MNIEKQIKTIIRLKQMKIKLLLILMPVFFIQGCGVYSFTGASISPEVESVQIKSFPNEADLVQPTLAQDLTNSLKEKFSAQTNLDVLDSEGDLVLEGAIRKYSTEPVAIQGDQTAALNRLSITIFVKFTNKIEPEQNFESTFTQYREYPSAQRLSEVEDGLIEEINGDLVEDIFNKAVVNW
jgi:hypothetical protein